jgi:hypothetical protein
MLGQHPQAFGLPELNLFTVDTIGEYWGRHSAETPGVRHGLLRAVAHLYAGEQTAATIAMAEHWVAAREERTTGEVFLELVDRVDPLIAVENSPAYTLSLRRLRRIYNAFPDARFIHLIRHPVLQGTSVMEWNYGSFAYLMNSFDFMDDRVVVDPQIAWHDINITILNFLHGVPSKQHITVRCEDLMVHPRERLAALCRWLGIRSDDAAVEAMMHPERSPFACFGPVTALCGNDPDFMRAPALRHHTPNMPSLDGELPWRDDGVGLRPEVVELAQEFGYR